MGFEHSHNWLTLIINLNVVILTLPKIFYNSIYLPKYLGFAEYILKG